MIGHIRFIARVSDSRYERTTFAELLGWLRLQDSFELDIETDTTDWWHRKKLISLQFGSTGGEPMQWFVQWSALTPEEQQELRDFLNASPVLKLAHNAKYEYIVLRFYGIILENLWCTMLAEKVLRGGEQSEDYALADISWKYCRVVMDKGLQLAFGDDCIDDEKILYAVTDVAWLTTIRDQQLAEASLKDAYGFDLLRTIDLEMRVLPAFGDITFNGLKIDREKWRQNITLAEPLVQGAYDKLCAWLTKDPFYDYCLDKGYLATSDRVTVNYNSVPQRTALLKLLFPDIAGATIQIVRKYISANAMFIGVENIVLLQDYMEKNYGRMQERLLEEHRAYLIEHGLLIPAGQVTINWNSNPQVLPLVQLVLPRIKGLSEEERNRHYHPMLKDLEDYKSALKLLTTYGESFLLQHVGEDDKVRTNFNQVLTTGRVSSASPNMQNIPAYDEVGTRYRNAFVCDPGFVFVDSDYRSQELAVIAYMSNDPVWLGCIERGEDLHSVCAELIYGNKWREAAEGTCGYYHAFVDREGVFHEANSRQKCDCKKHKTLRSGIKSINFGLAYGMSEFKLAGDLRISVRDAKALMELYFATFPAIKRLLDWLGQFGVEHGYILTLGPFNRRRQFPYWELHKPYIPEHIAGVRYNPTLGEIERASKNMPIQGTSADMVKLALVMMRDHIKSNNLWDVIFLVMQVHDQITAVCLESVAPAWKEEMDRIMCGAARVVIPTGILKAETQISAVWTK